MNPEDALPQWLLARASVQGREYAWKLVDIPAVLEAALQAGLAVTGGQLQFRAPEATFELYWIEFSAAPRQEGEPWNEFSARSILECSDQLRQLITQYDFVAEGARSLELLRQMQKAGVALSEYLCFVIYIESETTYRDLVF